MDEDYVRALAYGLPPTGRRGHRHRPAHHAADRLQIHPRRDPVPAAAASRPPSPKPRNNSASRTKSPTHRTDEWGSLLPFALLEVEGLDAEELGGLTQLFLDAQELVVLADAVGAAGRAGLDLAGAGGHGEVGDEGVFGFAGAVADDAGVAVAAASSMASMVSVTVPIWLSLIRMELAMPSSMPRCRSSVLVTKMSSPTSWICCRACRSGCFQPSQSSSARPSSRETMGYWPTQAVPEIDHLLGGALGSCRTS